jgi:hypothetical protein
VRAEGRESAQGQKIRPAIYGERPTKQVISNTVTGVMRQYCYGSFAEYQAILSLFNIRADRGAEDSEMFLKGGLQYSILDGSRMPVGVPIKASSIYSRPRLKELEKRFEKNSAKKPGFKSDLKAELDQLFFKFRHPSRELFTTELLKSRIDVIFRASENGQLYGVTYVDHRNKVVMNGSELGKAYSAKALTERFEKARLIADTGKESKLEGSGRKVQPTKNHELDFQTRSTPTSFLSIALAQTQSEAGIKVPKRRKKRRKGKLIDEQQRLNV